MGMSDRRAVFFALHDAINWQRGLADAYRHIEDSPERAEALATIRQYKAVLRKRYGSDRHAGEDRLDGAKLVTLAEIRAKHES